MKHVRKLFLSLLVLCLIFSIAPLHTTGHAEWLTVTFSKVDRALYAPDVKLFSYYYNPWAATLIVRGNGEMPKFDEQHPVPWRDLRVKAKRIILERGITSIPAAAFEDFRELRSVVIPSTIREIDSTAFRGCDKLERIESVLELKWAEGIVRNSGSRELTAASLVKITEEENQKEIWNLTHYWQDDVYVEYDNAGRPVHVVERKQDGTVADTWIDYLSQADALIYAESDAAAQRSDSVVLPAEKSKPATEFVREIDEYGNTVFLGNYTLNANGRWVAGTEVETIEQDDGTKVIETGVLRNAQYAANGDGKRLWTYSYTPKLDGSITSAVSDELVNLWDQVLEVKTTYLDANGQVVKTTTEKNKYDISSGKLLSTTTTTAPAGGSATTETVTYNYSAGKLKSVSSTSGDESVFEYDSLTGLLKKATVKEDGEETVSEYTYTPNGKKASKTVTAGGSKTVYLYDANERIISEITTKSASKTAKSTLSFHYQEDGQTLVKALVVDENGEEFETEEVFSAEELEGDIEDAPRMLLRMLGAAAEPAADAEPAAEADESEDEAEPAEDAEEPEGEAELAEEAEEPAAEAEPAEEAEEPEAEAEPAEEAEEPEAETEPAEEAEEPEAEAEPAEETEEPKTETEPANDSAPADVTAEPEVETPVADTPKEEVPVAEVIPEPMPISEPTPVYEPVEPAPAPAPIPEEVPSADSMAKPKEGTIRNGKIFYKGIWMLLEDYYELVGR